MKNLDEMQIALIKNQFKLMVQDIGLDESYYVLTEILQTANILIEVLIDEEKRKTKEGKMDK